MSLLDLPQLRGDRAAWLEAVDDPPTLDLTDEELRTLEYRLLAHHFPNLLAAYTTTTTELSAAQTRLTQTETERDALARELATLRPAPIEHLDPLCTFVGGPDAGKQARCRVVSAIPMPDLGGIYWLDTKSDPPAYHWQAK